MNRYNPGALRNSRSSTRATAQAPRQNPGALLRIPSSPNGRVASGGGTTCG